jgi:hypothetical protein
LYNIELTTLINFIVSVNALAQMARFQIEQNPPLLCFLACSHMVPTIHHYLSEIFHVHVDAQGKGIKKLGLKKVGY